MKYVLTALFTIFFCCSYANQDDTTFIDSLTERAYIVARENSEWSISNAHHALKTSKLINYPKGMADASLALGAAYLAKYNPNDSAGYYYHLALNIYSRLNNFNGQARACYGLSYVYNFKSNAAKAEEFGNRSVQNFRKAGNPKEEIAALSSVIYLAKQDGNYEKALELSNKAVGIARSINDTAQWADALNNKGNVLKDMFLFNPAIDAYFEAYRLWQNAKDSSGLAIAYGSIANAYFFEGDFKKSLEYNFKKLSITNNSGNLWETNKTMNNIASAYSNLNKHDSALFYMQKSLRLAKELNYPEGVANTYNTMASTFLKTENSDSTLFYSSAAVSIAEKINSSNLAKYELNKAMALEKQKKYTAALAIALKAYNQAKGKNDSHTVRDASFLLNGIYFHLGQRDMAYSYLTEYLKLNDSITNMDYMRKVTRLDLQHKYETKQRLSGPCTSKIKPMSTAQSISTFIRGKFFAKSLKHPSHLTRQDFDSDDDWYFFLTLHGHFRTAVAGVRGQLWRQPQTFYASANTDFNPYLYQQEDSEKAELIAGHEIIPDDFSAFYIHFDEDVVKDLTALKGTLIIEDSKQLKNKTINESETINNWDDGTIMSDVNISVQ